ncbi:Kin17_mid domain-containing protein, partial [Haematococcus lacustris]
MHKELDAKKRESEAAALRAMGVVVKVMAKELAPHGYYKQKGVVEKVIDKYVGEVAMLGSGDVVRVDQAQLETVIPQPGGTVLMVNGVHRGSKAVLEEIDVEKFRA